MSKNLTIVKGVKRIVFIYQDKRWNTDMGPVFRVPVGSITRQALEDIHRLLGTWTRTLRDQRSRCHGERALQFQVLLCALELFAGLCRASVSDQLRDAWVHLEVGWQRFM